MWQRVILEIDIMRKDKHGMKNVYMKKLYLVKDLARETRHSVYTVKYYYKLGLIRELGRTPYTDFKFFDGDAVKRILKIRKLRKQGYSLDKIKILIKEISR